MLATAQSQTSGTCENEYPPILEVWIGDMAIRFEHYLCIFYKRLNIYVYLR